MQNEIIKKLSTGIELKYSESLGLRVVNTGNEPYGSLQMSAEGNLFYINMSGSTIEPSNIEEFNERIAMLQQSMIEANAYMKELFGQ